MTSILVRNLDEDVKLGLKERARRNGRSMEAEARSILAVAVLGRATASRSEEELATLGARIRARFTDIDTEGLIFPRSTEMVSDASVFESDSPA